LPAGEAALREAQGSAWHANLELAFATRAARTVLTRNRHLGPLVVQKPLYPEGGQTCHIAILHPPGGIAAGDRLRVEAELQPGSRALLTTPGATKWYRSEGAVAHQDVRFALAADAVLEWLPREGIVFNGAIASSRLEVTLASRAGYVGWDIMSFGRRASGERWTTGRLRLHTAIRREERLLWAETADLDASSRFGEASVGLSGFTACGTLAVAGYAIGDELLAACRSLRCAEPGSRSGITRVPEVLLARCLGDSTEAIFDWFSRLWALLRPELSNRVACAPRVWAC
jgi:urease accessory protein